MLIRIFQNIQKIIFMSSINIIGVIRSCTINIWLICNTFCNLLLCFDKNIHGRTISKHPATFYILEFKVACQIKKIKRISWLSISMKHYWLQLPLVSETYDINCAINNEINLLNKNGAKNRTERNERSDCTTIRPVQNLYCKDTLVRRCQKVQKVFHRVTTAKNSFRIHSFYINGEKIQKIN